MAVRLAGAGVALLTGVRVDVLKPGLIELQPGGDQLAVDRVVTLPRLDGPDVQGLPADARGFLPVDRHGRVQGVQDVYAAGDATHFPIKQGGLACQQADAAAESIAAQRRRRDRSPALRRDAAGRVAHRARRHRAPA